jgi:hypothetical protein
MKPWRSPLAGVDASYPDFDDDLSRSGVWDLDVGSTSIPP